MRTSSRTIRPTVAAGGGRNLRKASQATRVISYHQEHRALSAKFAQGCARGHHELRQDERRVGVSRRSILVKGKKNSKDDEDVDALIDDFEKMLKNFQMNGPPVEDAPKDRNDLGEEEEEEEDLDALVPMSLEQIMAQTSRADFQETTPGFRSGYIAIVGRPNAGKSTLMNALVGTKLSIVTYKPQTTRHRILGIISNEDYQMILLDTPGVMDKRKNKMEEYMFRSVRDSMKDADAVLALVDASGKTPKEALDGMLPKHAKQLPMTIVLNKCDVLKNSEVSELLKFYQEKYPSANIETISALKNIGVDSVTSWAAEQLPLGPALYPKDVISEHPERFFIAEIVREQIFLNYSQEVPYAAQVVVVGYQIKGKGNKDFIEVDVIVERDTQKAIIIGRKGEALKKVATNARLEIEKFLDKKVYLQVQVKVKKGWQSNEGILRDTGLINNNPASSI